jgi:hypothetical protein
VPAVPKLPGAPPAPHKREILVVSHCSLFYWWPVWAVGFLMFLITAFTGEYMVTVPTGAYAQREGATVPVEAKKKGEAAGEEKRDALIFPKDHHLRPKAGPPEQPRLWMTTNKNLGVFLVAVLLFRCAGSGR